MPSLALEARLVSSSGSLRVFMLTFTAIIGAAGTFIVAAFFRRRRSGCLTLGNISATHQSAKAHEDTEAVVDDMFSNFIEGVCFDSDGSDSKRRLGKKVLNGEVRKMPRGFANVGDGEAYVKYWPDMPRVLEKCQLRLQSQALVNLQGEGLASELELNEVLHAFGRGRGGFRRFGSRHILDFKITGLPAFQLTAPFDVLNPIVRAMTEVAEQSLRAGEELALLQLLVNYYKDGTKAVKAHKHRCRHVCLSLGASRNAEVEGVPVSMSHGDCLVLGGEVHAVPPTETGTKTRTRVSVCLFYSNAEEYEAGTVGVPAKGGMWFTHPQDVLNEKIAKRTSQEEQ